MTQKNGSPSEKDCRKYSASAKLLLRRLFFNGLEYGQRLVVVEEGQLRTLDFETVHVVEHLDERIFVLHVGAGHPGHAHILEFEFLALQLIAAEETVAVGASGDHRVGGIELQREEIRLLIDRLCARDFS